MLKLKLNFELINKTYNPEFVTKIRQSEKEVAEGKTVTIKKEDLKQLMFR